MHTLLSLSEGIIYLAMQSTTRNLSHRLSQSQPQRRYVISPLLSKVNKMALSSSSTSSSDISTSSFKTWPVPMVESRGDYREEAHLEQLIHGPLYSSQGTLPRLPIPSINETISTFLPTALPLAETEEEADKLKEACEAFPIQAAKLHNRLESRKNEMDSNSSWLQLWWNTEGYLKSKDSECCQRLFAL